MPKEYTLQELFGGSPQVADFEERVPSIADVDAEAEAQATREFDAKELFAPRQDVAYEVEQLFQEQPGFATRFVQELPGVVSDIGQAAKGVVKDVLFEDMNDEEKEAGRRLYRDIGATQLPRAGLQGALQLSATVSDLVNRPLALAGVEGANETADKAHRIVTALGEKNAKKAASGIVGQMLGEKAGAVSESVVSSLAEQFLGAGVLKAAGAANNATRAAMLYTGLSTGGRALTEAEDMKLQGPAKIAYAGIVGGLNAAFIGLGGVVAKKLGLETAEEALFSDVQPVFKELLTRTGALKALGGAAIEAGEEGLTELSTGINKAIFDGEPSGAFDRIVTKLRDPEFQEQVATAAAAGAGARGVIGGMKTLATGIQNAAERVPGSMDRLVERVQVRKDRAALEAREQVTTSAAEASPGPVNPTATPEAAGEVLPDATGAPPASVSEVAEAAPPDVVPLLETAEEPPVGPPTRQAPSDAEPLTDIKLANRPMAELAKRLGRGDSYYSPGTRGLREAGMLAIRAGVPDNAVDISTAVLSGDRQLTSVEEVGLGVKAMELANKLEANRSRMSQATDPGEIAQLTAEADNAGRDFDIIRDALEKGGTDPARLLAYRRHLFPDDITATYVEAKLKKARQGPLSESDKAFATSVAKENSEAQTRLAEKRQQQNEEIAAKAIADIKGEPASVDETQEVLTRIRQLIDEGCDLE